MGLFTNSRVRELENKAYEQSGIISDLTAQLNDALATIERMKGENQLYAALAGKDSPELLVQSDEQSKNIMILNNKIRELQAQLEASQSVSKFYSNQIVQLKAQLAEHKVDEQSTKGLEEQIEEYKQQLEEHKRIIAQRNEKIKKLRQKLDIATGKHLASYSTALYNGIKQINENDDRCNKLNEQIVEYEGVITTLMDETKNIIESLKEKDKLIEYQQAQIAELRRKINELQTAEITRNLQNLQNANNANNANNAEIAQRVALTQQAPMVEMPNVEQVIVDMPTADAVQATLTEEQPEEVEEQFEEVVETSGLLELSVQSTPIASVTTSLTTEKTHLEEGDVLTWFARSGKSAEQNGLQCTWHSNGRLSMLGRDDLTFNEVTWYASHGDWFKPQDTPDGINRGGDYNKWMFNGQGIKDLARKYPGFYSKIKTDTIQNAIVAPVNNDTDENIEETLIDQAKAESVVAPTPEEIAQRFGGSIKPAAKKPRVARAVTHTAYSIEDLLSLKKKTSTKVDIGAWEINDTGYTNIKSITSDVSKLVGYAATKEAIAAHRFASNEPMNRPCVYVLFNQDKVYYVGESGNANTSRLYEHTESYTAGTHLDWTHCIWVCNADWNKVNTLALEVLLTNEISERCGYVTDNTTRNEGKEELKKNRDKYARIYSQLQEIFTYFGSDCLTRGVISHDTSGCLSIYDSSMQVTPQFICEKMLDMLPPDVFSPGTTFMNIACKNGMFIKCIYDRLMNSRSMINAYPDEVARANYIRNNQLFALLCTEHDYVLRVRQELLQFVCDNHMSVINKLDVRNLSYETLINTWQKVLGGIEMKFDVIIGNPPYQMDTSDKRAGAGKITLYDDFVRLGLKLQPQHFCMITKSEWMTGNASKDIRALIINNGLKSIIDWPATTPGKRAFADAAVAAAAFYCRKNYKGEINYTQCNQQITISHYSGLLSNEINFIPTNEYDLDIFNKLLSYIKQHKSVADTNYFGTHAPEYGWTSNFNIYGDQTDKTIKDEPDDIHNISILAHDGPRYFTKWLSRAGLKSSSVKIIGAYKVVCANKIHKSAMCVTDIRLLGPNECHTDSWTRVGVFNTKEEAENYMTYVKSKLYRYILWVRCTQQHSLSNDRFIYTPVLDFTPANSIWYNEDGTHAVQSIIDQRLFDLFELTQEEQAFINKTIKAYD